MGLKEPVCTEADGRWDTKKNKMRLKWKNSGIDKDTKTLWSNRTSIMTTFEC